MTQLTYSGVTGWLVADWLAALTDLVLEVAETQRGEQDRVELVDQDSVR